MEQRRTYFRWVVCGLLFLSTTINYIDRQVIGILKPLLEKELGWNQIDYGNIVFSFQLAYAIGYSAAGRLIDGIGVRVGLALAVGFWSFAAAAHAAARSVLAFCLARFGLGLAEGGNFPGSIKAVAEWFPKRERALATGLFNSGSNIGALITPLLVPWLAVRFGWPVAFLVTGVLGFLWLAAWLLLYQDPGVHSLVNEQERAYIRSDPPEPEVEVPWLELLRHPQTWAFSVGMFLSGPIWWFYLYWIPDFLNKRHGVNLIDLGPPLVTIYLMTDGGSIGGGWISSHLIKKGWSVSASRKTAMLICALCVVPIFMASRVEGLWTAVFLVGLAASAHSGFAANLFTIVSDTVPKPAVSSVVGIGGTAAAIGGMFIAKLVGYILHTTNNNYMIPFAIASCAYLVALGIIHLLLPGLRPMNLDRLARPKPGV